MNIIKGYHHPSLRMGLSHYCIMMSRLSSLYRERLKSHRIRREGMRFRIGLFILLVNGLPRFWNGIKEGFWNKANSLESIDVLLKQSIWCDHRRIGSNARLPVSLVAPEQWTFNSKHECKKWCKTRIGSDRGWTCRIDSRNSFDWKRIVQEWLATPLRQNFSNSVISQGRILVLPSGHAGLPNLSLHLVTQFHLQSFMSGLSTLV